MALFAGVAAADAGASGPQGVPERTVGAREVVLVANAEGGDVAVVDAHSFRVMRRIDVLPDGPSATPGEDDPAQALIGQQIVEAAGGQNYAQDQDVSPDGRTLYVSRGHRGDIAAFDIATGTMRWKLPIPGFRSDHMAISRDGRRLYVSALTEDEVEVVDTEQRAIVASFPSGQWPHDNHLSDDGERLYNGSIGNVVAPSEARGANGPPYRLTVVDAQTLAPIASHVFDRGIRPYVITHDERRLFAQLSELHGVVEFDLAAGRELRRRELPIDPGVTEEDYDFEAPHHGLAMSHDERTLCAAGRASDYVALIATRTLEPNAIIEVDDAPGWAATDPDGHLCFVPNTRADTLSVISFARRREIARFGIGDGPKQIEAARIPAAVLCNGPAVPGCAPELRLARRCLSRGRAKVRLDGEVDAVREVAFTAGDRLLARDRHAPFVKTLRRSTLRELRGRRLRAVADVSRGPAARAEKAGALPSCGGRLSR
jgi:DNA-binding beta-propeller fold protein YncE